MENETRQLKILFWDGANPRAYPNERRSIGCKFPTLESTVGLGLCWCRRQVEQLGQLRPLFVGGDGFVMLPSRYSVAGNLQQSGHGPQFQPALEPGLPQRVSNGLHLFREGFPLLPLAPIRGSLGAD